MRARACYTCEHVLATRARTCFLHVRARYLFVRARLLFKNVRPGQPFFPGSGGAPLLGTCSYLAAERVPSNEQLEFNVEVLTPFYVKTS